MSRSAPRLGASEFVECRDCGSVGDFYFRKDGRLMQPCRACVRVRQQQYNATNKDRVRERNLQKNYGMSSKDYEAMATAQGWACAICKQVPGPDLTRHTYGLVIDHHHATGRIRLLLCRNCNSAIGMLGDDPELLRRAALYVELL